MLIITDSATLKVLPLEFFLIMVLYYIDSCMFLCNWQKREIAMICLTESDVGMLTASDLLKDSL